MMISKKAADFRDPQFRRGVTNLVKINLVLALLAQATTFLQQKFKSRWAACNDKEWDADAAGHAHTLVEGLGQKWFRRLGKIQKGLLQSGNVDGWDITLLAEIFGQLDLVDQPVDKQERNCLDQLTQVRNKSAHTPHGAISDQEFEVLWAKVEPVAAHLGSSPEELRKIKCSTNVTDLINQNTSTINSETAIKFKEKGNQLFKEKQFQDAVDAYTNGISLVGLSQADRAVLYSNRSAAYLEIAQQMSLTQCGSIPIDEAQHCALTYAKESMRLNPAWYKGYVRAGFAYRARRKYAKAVRAFDWALSLAIGDKEIQNARDECRRKLGIDERNDHFKLQCLRPTPEENRRNMEKTLGRPITMEMYLKLTQTNEGRIPGQADVNSGLVCYEAIPPDLVSAASYFTKATKAGNSEGTYYLAMMYKMGRGVKQDFAMSIKLLKQAASCAPFWNENINDPVVGVAAAELFLGLAYYEGVGIQLDFQEARKWYKKSSQHGCTNATHNLGILYQNGEGGPVDMKRASQYWQLATPLFKCYLVGP